MDARVRFEGLYRAHAAAVGTYARRRGLDGDAVDDVVADVFVVVWRRLGDVPEDALPWMLGVARRVLANRHRGVARERALRHRIASEGRRIAGEAGRSQSVERVGRALGRLGERDREALLLVAWEGLSPAQAARALGLHPNTFAVRLYRARRRFAKALENEAQNPGRELRSAGAEVSP